MPKFSAIGIVSSDLERSRAFYRLLGLEISAGDDHVSAETVSGIYVMFDTEDVMRSFRPEWKRETGNQVALAFECGTPAEVDETYARVVDAGFESVKEPWDAFWGQRYAQLRDPDGVGIDLHATL